MTNRNRLIAHANLRLALADRLHQIAVGAYGSHQHTEQIRVMRLGIKAREIAIRSMRKSVR